MEKIWGNMGFISQGVKNFSAKEAFTLCQLGTILLDVRDESMTAFKQFNADNVLLIPLIALKQNDSTLVPQDYIICADSVGLRSIEAVKFLIAKGFENVANLPGGIVDWENDGLPIEISTKNRLSGSCICQLKPRERK